MTWHFRAGHQFRYAGCVVHGRVTKGSFGESLIYFQLLGVWAKPGFVLFEGAYMELLPSLGHQNPEGTLLPYASAGVSRLHSFSINRFFLRLNPYYLLVSGIHIEFLFSCVVLRSVHLLTAKVCFLRISLILFPKMCIHIQVIGLFTIFAAGVICLCHCTLIRLFYFICQSPSLYALVNKTSL